MGSIYSTQCKSVEHIKNENINVNAPIENNNKSTMANPSQKEHVQNATQQRNNPVIKRKKNKNMSGINILSRAEKAKLLDDVPNIVFIKDSTEFLNFIFIECQRKYNDTIYQEIKNMENIEDKILNPLNHILQRLVEVIKNQDTSAYTYHYGKYGRCIEYYYNASCMSHSCYNKQNDDCYNVSTTLYGSLENNYVRRYNINYYTVSLIKFESLDFIMACIALAFIEKIYDIKLNMRTLISYNLIIKTKKYIFDLSRCSISHFMKIDEITEFSLIIEDRGDSIGGSSICRSYNIEKLDVPYYDFDKS